MCISTEEVLQWSGNQRIQLSVGRFLQMCMYWVCAQGFQESLFTVATWVLKMWIYSHYHCVALKSDTVNSNYASHASFPHALFSTSSIHSSNDTSSNHSFSVSACSACLDSMSCIQKSGENLLHFHLNCLVYIIKWQGACKP